MVRRKTARRTRRPIRWTRRKWHLTSKARGETDLMLNVFVAGLDPQTGAAGEKAAKPWLDAIAAKKLEGD